MALDFPSSPTTGQVYGSWQWNGTAWVGAGSAAVAGDITAVVAGAGLAGGGTTGDVTLSLATPVAVANGGTGSTTAPAALSALGAVAKSGDTMTGNLTTPRVNCFNTSYTSLQVSGDNNATSASLGHAAGAVYLDSGASANLSIQASQALLFYTGSPLTQRLSIDVNGNTVMSGTATFNSYLMCNIAGQTSNNFNTGGSANLFICDTGTAVGNGGTLTFCASGSSWRFAAIKASVTDAGNNSMGHLFISTRRANTDTTLTQTALFADNGLCVNTSGSWGVFSDRSLKQDVEPYERGLDAILNLRPVQFRYQAGTPFTSADEPSKLYYGLIADEVLPHIPEVCGTMELHLDDDIEGETRTVATLSPTDLIYSLVNAVKTLAEQSEQLAMRLDALEAAR